ncbi:MAG TPA: hypothetical protein VKA86_01040 [Candidatus Krumholzibacteria bacterium]|nr:hypothetical protein [Candidatus Krumholzibacteria bacterium]
MTGPRTGFVVLGLLTTLATTGTGRADPLVRSAPGRDDTSALRPGRWTAPLTTALEFGSARPWAELPVRTDWVDLRWAGGAVAFALAGARTTAGSVHETDLAVDVELRSGASALRVQAGRREITVDGFDPRTAIRARGALRHRLGPVRAVGVIERDPGRVRRWSWALGIEAEHAGLRLRLDHRARRHTDTRDWSIAAVLEVAGPLDLSVDLDPDRTTWGLAVRSRPWGLRVGRVVDGPREGAVAVAVEWRP